VLLKLLKLLGLDVPARVEAIKGRIEQRLDVAAHHIAQLIQEIALIGALWALAASAGAAAIGLGLACLYMWATSVYGVYAGLGLVGAVLAFAAAVFAIAATLRTKSLGQGQAKLPARQIMAADAPTADAMVARDHPAPPHPVPSVVERAVEPSEIGPASDLSEPLGFVFSKLMKYPATGNPVLDGLIIRLYGLSYKTVDEAIQRAASIIRNGDRTSLVLVLSGAGLLGWLLGRNARH